MIHAVTTRHPRITWTDGAGTIHQPVSEHPTAECATQERNTTES